MANNHSGQFEEISSPYLDQLNAELEKLEATGFENAIKLVKKEINNVKQNANPDVLDLVHKNTIRIRQKVFIPTEEYPDYNFVGKLLGPGGSTLKTICQESGAKIAILGKGSMKDKTKEEELRVKGGEHEHLSEPLHLRVDVRSSPIDAYRRVATALSQVSIHLNPTQEDIGAQLAARGGDMGGMVGPAGRGRPVVRGGGTAGYGASAGFPDFEYYRMASGYAGGPMKDRGAFRPSRPAPYNGVTRRGRF